CSPSSTVRADTATSYPTLARWTAMAFPIPLLAPVTNATRVLTCRHIRTRRYRSADGSGRMVGLVHAAHATADRRGRLLRVRAAGPRAGARRPYRHPALASDGRRRGRRGRLRLL